MVIHKDWYQRNFCPENFLLAKIHSIVISEQFSLWMYFKLFSQKWFSLVRIVQTHVWLQAYLSLFWMQTLTARLMSECLWSGWKCLWIVNGSECKLQWKKIQLSQIKQSNYFRDNKSSWQKKGFFPLYIQVYVIVFLNTLNFFEYPNYNIVKWDGILKLKK